MYQNIDVPSAAEALELLVEWMRGWLQAKSVWSAAAA